MSRPERFLRQLPPALGVLRETRVARRVINSPERKVFLVSRLKYGVLKSAEEDEVLREDTYGSSSAINQWRIQREKRPSSVRAGLRAAPLAASLNFPGNIRCVILCEGLSDCPEPLQVSVLNSFRDRFVPILGVQLQLWNSSPQR